MQLACQHRSPAFVCSLKDRAEGMRDPAERLRLVRRALREPGEPRRTGRWRVRGLAAACVLLLPANIASEYGAFARPPLAHTEVRSKVWLAERGAEFELYSNGLRIDTGWSTGNRPRRYRAFKRSVSDNLEGEWRGQPVGIVFHTTEGHLVPFEPAQNRALVRQSSGLLEYVRNGRLYNYVIDRFGRVCRVVEESDAANHAGHSVWADAQWLYVNLNDSFLGVAFEAEGAGVTSAQTHAARILTEMLRSKYGIAGENCVTHAQVSVNPGNRRIGYHTDWVRGFPFREVGLSDNYEQPLPGISLFGFSFDLGYIDSAAPQLGKGLLLAQEQLRQEAALRGIAVGEYRAALQERYRQMGGQSK